MSQRFQPPLLVEKTGINSLLNQGEADRKAQAEGKGRESFPDGKPVVTDERHEKGGKGKEEKGGHRKYDSEREPLSLGSDGCVPKKSRE